jgi:phage-related minor tail protein
MPTALSGGSTGSNRIDQRFDQSRNHEKGEEQMTEDDLKKVETIVNAAVIAATKALMGEILALLQKQSTPVDKLVGSVEQIVTALRTHTDAIDTLMKSGTKTMKFVDGLAIQYGQIFKALSSRITALETGEPASPMPPMN